MLGYEDNLCWSDNKSFRYQNTIENWTQIGRNPNRFNIGGAHADLTHNSSNKQLWAYIAHLRSLISRKKNAAIWGKNFCNWATLSKQRFIKRLLQYYRNLNTKTD